MATTGSRASDLDQNCLLAARGNRRLRRQHLVDAPAIEIHDLEAPVLEKDVVADAGQPPERLDQQSGDRVVVPVFGDHQPKRFGQLVRLHPAGDEQRAILALHDRGLRIALVGGKAAYDRLQNIGRCDDALEVAVLVMHEAHVNG